MAKKEKANSAEKHKKTNELSKKPLLFSVGAKDKIFFARHLSVLLKAGIPVREAISALLDQAKTTSIKYILTICRETVEGGDLLASAFTKFPRIFDAFFSNVVRVGEQSGTLAESLEYLANQMEKTREIQGKVRSALFYPLIILVGALIIGGYLSFFLLPKLIPLFATIDSELPFTTRFLIALTEWLRAYWIHTLTGAIIILAALIFLWRLKSTRAVFHGFFLRLPGFGGIVQQIQSTQFSLILGTLLTAGVKIVPALRITADSLKNLVYTHYLHKVANRVERGETIGEQLRAKKVLFAATTTSMVEVGEKTGRLSQSLLALATFLEKEVDRVLENISSLIGPVVLIVVGLFVGFIALSVISPLYQLTQSLTF